MSRLSGFKTFEHEWAKNLALAIVTHKNDFYRFCGAIEAEYKRLEHRHGWRFLTSPSATFSRSQKILLLTLNPAGNRDYPEHPRESSESGSAYLVESWDDRPPGKAKLQQQVRLMFSELARHIDFPSGDELLSQSLSAHFVPFRSSNLASLHEKDKSLVFAQKLWTDVLSCVNPTLIITLNKEAFEVVVGIETELQNEKPYTTQLPIGWGSYTATIARFSDGPAICWFPHLSRFAIFGREKSSTHVRRILEEVTTGFGNQGNENRWFERAAELSTFSVTPSSPNLGSLEMSTIHLVQQPSKPFRQGSARNRAWHIMQAFDGLPVEEFVVACGVMERASGVGGDPKGWVNFFTATGRYEARPHNPNASERLAEIRD